MTEWQPIETAPKDTAILVYHNMFTVAHFNTAFGRWIGYGQNTSEFINGDPTHWMPLPQVPVANGEHQ